MRTDQRGELLARILDGLERLTAHGVEPFEPELHDRVEQFVLRARVVVHRRDRDAGGLRDVADAGPVEAALGEQQRRGLQETLLGAFGLCAASALRRAGGHLPSPPHAI